ncbi:hypothetical protein HYV98_02005 [Candidatus Azambacteria bacterium]|nr:hypothetical protein [Candidatus Azambacteria bacterium]
MRRSAIALFLFVMFFLPVPARAAGLRIEGESAMSRFIVPDGVSLPEYAREMKWQAYSTWPARYVDLPSAVNQIARDMAMTYARFGFVFLFTRLEVSLAQFDDGDHYFLEVFGLLWPADVPGESEIFFEQIPDRVEKLFGAVRLYGRDLVAAQLGVKCTDIKFSLESLIADFKSDYLKLEGNVTASCVEAAAFPRSLGVAG